MKTIKRLFILSLIFTLITCSKKEENNINDEIDTEIDENELTIIDLESTYNVFQVVSFSVDNTILESNQYQGKVGDFEVTLAKTSDNELSFLAPEAEGDTELIIEEIYLKIKYKTTKLEIKDTPENIIDDVAAKIENYTPASEEDKKTQTFIHKFSQEIKNASEEEKSYFVNLYSANKNLFDAILIPTNTNSSKVFYYAQDPGDDWEARNKELLREYTTDLTVMSGAIVIAAASNVRFPIVTSLAAGVAIGYFVLAKESYEEFMNYNVSILGFVIETIENQLNSKTAKIAVTNNMIFNEGEISTLEISYDIRKINQNDLFTNTIGFETLKEAINKANNKIKSLNDKIRWVNAKLDTNVEEIDLFEIDNEATLTSENINSSIFNYFDFSVSNTNVKIKSVVATDNGLNIILEVDEAYKSTLDKDADDNSEKDITEITTNLNYTYNSYFNSKQGSIPVTLKLKDCNNEFGGTAYNSECDVCVGGNTGKTEEEECTDISELLIRAWKGTSKDENNDTINITFYDNGKYETWEVQNGIVESENEGLFEWSWVEENKTHIKMQLDDDGDASDWEIAEVTVNENSLILKFSFRTFYFIPK